MGSTDGKIDWAAYESEKKKLQDLPSDEYQMEVRELARRMRI